MSLPASSRLSRVLLAPLFMLVAVLLACNPSGTPDRTVFLSEFAGYDADGKRLDLGSLGQKPVVMDVWAIWCGPCIDQRANLHELQKDMGDQVIIVGMSVDQDREAWTRYVKDHPAPHLDLYGESNTGEALEVRVIPTLALFDKNGMLVRVITGTKSAADLKRLVQPLL